MESQTKCGDDRSTPPLPGQSNNSLKFEVIDHDFCIDNYSSSSSKTYLQDFHHLDQLPLIKASSFNPDHIDTHLNVFDPFFHGFDLYEDSKPYDNGNGIAMQSFDGGGFLSCANRKDLLMEIDGTSMNHDPNPLSMFVPDESSCITAFSYKENGIKRGKCGANESGAASAKKSSVGRRKVKSGKGQWTPEEDRLLIHLVEKYGEKKWSRIAQVVKGRIGKQCRERWHNHLRPDIKKDVWTEEEDRVLIKAHAEVGNKWAEIAKKLPGRTENSIKNHWNATKRRQLSRRKCKTKWPRPNSLLQNYIKSLSSEKGSSSRLRNNAAAAPCLTADVETARNLSNDACEMDFSPAGYAARDYEIDDVTDFSFMDDLPEGSLPRVQDEACFDMELQFDMLPLMQHGI